MSEKRKINTEKIAKRIEKIKNEFLNIIKEEEIDKHQRNSIIRSLNDYKRRLATIEEKNKSLILENEHLRSKMQNINNKENLSDIGYEEKEVPVEEQRIEQELKSELFKKEEKIFELERKIEKLQNVKIEKQEVKEVKNVESVVTDNKELEELREQNLKIQENLIEANSKLDSEIQKNNLELNLKNERIKFLEKNISFLEEGNQKLVKENLHDRNFYIKKVEMYEDKIHELKKNEIHNLKTENKFLKEEAIQLDNKVSNLKEQMSRIAGEREEYKKLLDYKNRLNILNSLDLENEKHLIHEIVNLSKNYEEVINHNKILLNRIENVNSNVIVESKYKIMNNESKIKDLETQIYNLEKNEKNLKIEIEKLKNDFNERKNAANYHKRNNMDIQNQLDLLIKKSKELENEKIKCDKLLLEEKFKLEKLVSENKKLTYTLSIYTENGNTPEVLNDLDNLKKLLRCSSCDDNYKDTVLLRCMHVFCKKCIDKRLQMRSRRCPTCGESFNVDNVKKIFL